MAKKRLDVGKVLKGKDGKPDYIQINQDVSLTKGMFLNLETKAQAIESLETAIKNGKISDEVEPKIRERIEKGFPTFVRFAIYTLVEK